MSTPLDFLSQGLVKAFLQIEQPQLPGDAGIVPVRFNPTSYQIAKQNNFAEIAIPGLETPPIQFIRGGLEKLTTELLVDTSDTLEDVREKYEAETDPLYAASRLWIDAIIDPRETRTFLSQALEASAHKTELPPWRVGVLQT